MSGAANEKELLLLDFFLPPFDSIRSSNSYSFFKNNDLQSTNRDSKQQMREEKLQAEMMTEFETLGERKMEIRVDDFW